MAHSTGQPWLSRWRLICCSVRLRTDFRKISSLRLVHERCVIWIHLFFSVKMKCSMISMKDGPWRNSKWSASTIPGIAVKNKGYWPSCVFKMRRWSAQPAKWPSGAIEKSNISRWYFLPVPDIIYYATGVLHRSFMRLQADLIETRQLLEERPASTRDV